ncbi:electron transfer flavoprotein subunit alpha/FixB family protein [Guggenheimella bovis]
MNIQDYKGVLVYLEQRDGNVQKVSLELLGKGRELADKLGEELYGVVIGADSQKIAEEVLHYGAEKAFFVSDDRLANYLTEPYAKALFQAINQIKPSIVLYGATSIGRDLAPRVSARVHTGLTADCTSLDIDPETRDLLMTRPAFGGNIMATIVCQKYRPQMSTVRPGVMIKPERTEATHGVTEEIKVDYTAEDFHIEVLEVVMADSKRKNIEEANVLVSAGRGMGAKENLDMIYDLAAALKGEVSGSRATIDSGWLEKDRQVGQTGKTVRPGLYMALGISGAIQHLAGMEESEFIVAVNKNPSAPIFEVADVGVVGDALKIVPLIEEELKKLEK